MDESDVERIIRKHFRRPEESIKAIAREVIELHESVLEGAVANAVWESEAGDEA